MFSDMISNAWTKIKRERGLYRYNPSGQYFARVRFHGKLYRKKLETDDLAVAKHKLRGFKDDLERTDETKGNTSFAKLLDDYAETLQGAESTLVNKLAVIAKLKKTWFGIASLPLRTVKPSQVSRWLTEHYGSWSAAYYNLALSVVSSALDMAVADRIITESPAKGLKYRKRKEPIRTTPTFEQFRNIVASIRNQSFNADAEDSGDFVEAMGLLGLGQAELANVKREHVRLDAGQIDIFRRKTGLRFTIPLFPQATGLVMRLCDGKKSGENLFKVKQARKAITQACRRLELPIYTHRSFRRMFITKAIERGVDVKVIAQWQGHKDGGRLILATYSHVRPEHSNRMALLMTDEQPENVVPITAQA
jgi:Site-specific recombinase XerD